MYVWEIVAHTRVLHTHTHLEKATLLLDWFTDNMRGVLSTPEEQIECMRRPVEPRIENVIVLFQHIHKFYKPER